MEIVYYWVENKGLIKRQGFNFSPEIECNMESVNGQYLLTIEKTGKVNIMTNSCVSNVTALVGKNGAGKTSLMKALHSIKCFPEGEDSRPEYKEYSEQRNDENRCLYLVKEEGKYVLTTNIKKALLIINSSVIITETKYYSDDLELHRKDINDNKGIFAFTSIYMTNASYNTVEANMLTHLGIENMAFMPAGLNVVKDAFFEFICPDKTRSKKTIFDEYSKCLRENKTVGQFQQLCDLYYCADNYDDRSNDTLAILKRAEYKIKVAYVKALYEDLVSDGKILNLGTNKADFERLWSAYEIKESVNPVIYTLKANLTAEFLMASGTDNITKCESSSIECFYQLIKEQLQTQGIKSCYTSYFRNAIDEIERLECILKNAEPIHNVLPKSDFAYEYGAVIKNGKHANEYFEFIKDCLEYNNKLAMDYANNKYGSFCLRYLAIDNLYLSSGERAFQNLVSWLYWLSQMGDITSNNRVIPKKNLLVCIDEIDDLCHPDWQRDIIGNIVNELKESFGWYSIQLVVSTHSPLCLSEIPKENIIFLNRDEKHGIYQDKSRKVQTFGRNIYDILNDSFYLNNKTIGGYAVDFIKTLINYINENEAEKLLADKDVIFSKIEYIGDDLIREKLYQMIEEKMGNRLSVEERKMFLNRKIELLKRELNDLEISND